MEVFVRNIPWTAARSNLVQMLAHHLHSPEFLLDEAPFNFNVQLPKGKGGENNGGFGFLTFPTAELGNRFLKAFPHGLDLFDRTLKFHPSRHPEGRPEIVEEIRNTRYTGTQALEECEDRSLQLSENRIVVGSVQFGWDCRDHVFSIESEAYLTGLLSFDDERRQFRMEFVHDTQRFYIAIPISQINFLAAHPAHNGLPVIFFKLHNPPFLEKDIEDIASQEERKAGGDNSTSARMKIPFLPLPHDHERTVPYTSVAIRLVCPFADALDSFQTLSELAGLRHTSRNTYPVERRNLFSATALDNLDSAIRSLPWPVAFQVEAIMRKRAMSALEMLEILPDIKGLVDSSGQRLVASFLQDFGPKVYALSKANDTHVFGQDTVRLCFEKALNEYLSLLSRVQDANEPPNRNHFRAMHLTLTPTTMILDGPHWEPSNRVVRKYKEHQHSFLRVSFAEEGRLKIQYDRDEDRRKYIQERIGSALMKGMEVAGRKFEFLGYSQSGLKDHTVWFVKPFRTNLGEWITANAIVADLGNFDDLEFDKDLIRCPARYAARLALAFTTTEAAITIDNGEQGELPDIKTTDGKYAFTDGVGTMSLAMASDIWKRIKRSKRFRSVKNPPSAYIIRFSGSKGVLSVDHTLRGRKIMLRKSMIKFKAPASNDIEIVRAIDRPSDFCLNRPLIMILEGLGVPYEVFKRFQDQAVKETYTAPESLAKAGKMLESHNLGASFRIPTVMSALHDLGLESLIGDRFYDKIIEFARDHILRNLKHDARIPIPGAWTLVGVADIHKFLQPGEVFACIQPMQGERFFLEGPVVISRSPVIHPGDVQVVRAIGKPPPSSCFEKEPLTNTVVFSVLGERPLPSCLGGGDLDGDIYNIIPLANPDLAGFRPVDTWEPGEYDSAPKNLLPADTKCTLDDVARFILDYFVSDVLGIVATTWLKIADQSEMGIFDEDCLALAEMHSLAVDYPKSGTPVDPSVIPRQKRKANPDWSRPETLAASTTRKFYPSTRAIGQLFRDIDLPVDNRSIRESVTAGSKAKESDVNDPRIRPVRKRVEQFVKTGDINRQLHQRMEKLFWKYKAQLQGIRTTRTPSSSRHGFLTEEEIFIGCISQRFTDQRKRKDMLSRLRESTDALVRQIRRAIEGESYDSPEDALRRFWCAWQVALGKGDQFGAQSFGWLALGGIFETICLIEEPEPKPGHDFRDGGGLPGSSLGKRRVEELEDDGGNSSDVQRKIARTGAWADCDVIDLTAEEPEVIDLTEDW